MDSKMTEKRKHEVILITRNTQKKTENLWFWERVREVFPRNLIVRERLWSDKMCMGQQQGPE